MLHSPSSVAGRSASLGRQGGDANPGLARKGTRGRVAAEPVASRACAEEHFEDHHIASGGDCTSIHLEGSGEGLASLAENPSRASLEPTPRDDITQDQASRRFSRAAAPTLIPPDSHIDVPFLTPPHLDNISPAPGSASACLRPPPSHQRQTDTSIL